MQGPLLVFVSFLGTYPGKLESLIEGAILPNYALSCFHYFLLLQWELLELMITGIIGLMCLLELSQVSSYSYYHNAVHCIIQRVSLNTMVRLQSCDLKVSGSNPRNSLSDCRVRLCISILSKPYQVGASCTWLPFLCIALF